MLPFNRKLLFEDLTSELESDEEANIRLHIHKQRNVIDMNNNTWNTLKGTSSPERGHPFDSVLKVNNVCKSSRFMQSFANEDHFEWFKSIMMFPSKTMRQKTVQSIIDKGELPYIRYAYAADGDYHDTNITIDIWNELINREEKEPVSKYYSPKSVNDDRMTTRWLEMFDDWRTDGQPAVTYSKRNLGGHSHMMSKESGWLGVGYISAYMTVKIADYVVYHSDGKECASPNDLLAVYNSFLESLMGRDTIPQVVDWMNKTEGELKPEPPPAPYDEPDDEPGDEIEQSLSNGDGDELPPFGL